MIFFLQEIRLWSIITGVDFSGVQEFIKSVSREDGTVDIIALEKTVEKVVHRKISPVQGKSCDLTFDLIFDNIKIEIFSFQACKKIISKIFCKHQRKFYNLEKRRKSLY